MRQKRKPRRDNRGINKSFISASTDTATPRKAQASPWGLVADAPAYDAAFGDEAFFRENPHRSFRIRRVEPNDESLADAGSFHRLNAPYDHFARGSFVLVAQHAPGCLMRIVAPFLPEDGDAAAQASEEEARMFFCGLTWNNNRSNTRPGTLRIIEKLRRKCAQEYAEFAAVMGRRGA
jgi:hypothetical protein